MLKCRDVTRESGDYIEQEISWRKAFQIKFHLLMCNHCRRFVHHLRMAVGYFNKLPPLTLNEDEAREIADSVRARVEKVKENDSE